MASDSAKAPIVIQKQRKLFSDGRVNRDAPLAPHCATNLAMSEPLFLPDEDISEVNEPIDDGHDMEEDFAGVKSEVELVGPSKTTKAFFDAFDEDMDDQFNVDQSLNSLSSPTAVKAKAPSSSSAGQPEIISLLDDDASVHAISPPPPASSSTAADSAPRPAKRRRLSPTSSSLSASSFKSASLGLLIVQAYATTSGTGYCTAGEALTFERPKVAIGVAKEKAKGKSKQMGIKDMFAGGGAAKGKKENTIIRFRNSRGFEVGRLPTDLTKYLVPLLDNSPPQISLTGTVIDAPTKLQVGCEIVLHIRVSLTAAAFKRKPLNEAEEDGKTFGWNEGKETDEEKEMKNRKTGLLELFKLCELKPKGKAGMAAMTESDKGSTGNGGGKGSEKKEKKIDKLEETGEEVELEGEELNENQLGVIYQKAQSNDRNLPHMEPASTFALTLRPYQKQALHWMYNLETSGSTTREDSLHPLWEEYEFPPEDGRVFGEKRPFWFNPYSGELSLEFVPAGGAGRGGILADEMGMGKSIMVASLIHTNRGPEPIITDPLGSAKPAKRKQLTLDSSFRAVQRRPVKERKFGPASTLIVAPMSLLAQWASELKRSSHKNALKVVIFHGDNRGDLEALTSYDDEDATGFADVVITSYGTLVSEHGKSSSGGMYDIEWKRVVLDEAHNIKSRLTKAAKACYALRSRTKWCLTGTPIINRLEDLHSLLQFLEFQPWANFSFFRSFITTPFLARDPKAIDVVQIILETILLRREKTMTDVDGKRIVELPPKEIVVEHLEFSPLERRIYDQIYQDAKTQFRKLNAKGLVGKNFSNILAMLMRLRQAVLHPQLIGGKKTENQGLEPDMDVNLLIARFASGERSVNEGLGEAYAKNVLEDLIAAQGDEEGNPHECPICLEIMDPPMLSPSCMHRTCKDCITGHLQSCEQRGEEGFCPVCRSGPLREEDLLEVIHQHTSRNTGRYSTRAPGSENQPPSDGKNVLSSPPPSPAVKFRKKSSNTSTKLDALSKDLRKLRDQDPVFRAVVFSQFTGFLDMIETVLDRDGFAWVRLDGQMQQKERTKALEEFAKPTRKPKIFLISLRAGGVGLNLTTANHVFMMDCWWNASVENQAIDRVHRIGQTRTVYVKHFVISHTIEMRILDIQKRKTALVKGALGEKSEGDAMDNLKLMFGDD